MSHELGSTRACILRCIHCFSPAIDAACRACGFAGECYGCRGNAYQATGDYLAADPGCWLMRTAAADICD